MYVDDYITELSRREINRIEKIQKKLSEVLNTQLYPRSRRMELLELESVTLAGYYADAHYAIVNAYRLCGEVIDYLSSCSIEDLRIIFRENQKQFEFTEEDRAFLKKYLVGL